MNKSPATLDDFSKQSYFDKSKRNGISKEI